MASMAMERVCVITAGKGHFVIPLQIIPTVFQPNAVKTPHAGVQLEKDAVSVMLVSQAMEHTAQVSTPALLIMVAAIKMPIVQLIYANQASDLVNVKTTFKETEKFALRSTHVRPTMVVAISMPPASTLDLTSGAVSARRVFRVMV